MKTEDIKMTLHIIMMKDYKAEITLKSKKHPMFIAKVQDFNFDEDDAKVILKRCEETVFPDQEKDETHTLYVKDIKNVERYV